MTILRTHHRPTLGPMDMALQQFDGMKLMPNLFLASVPVWVCIRICTVSLLLKQTASKIELLCHLPV